MCYRPKNMNQSNISNVFARRQQVTTLEKTIVRRETTAIANVAHSHRLEGDVDRPMTILHTRVRVPLRVMLMFVAKVRCQNPAAITVLRAPSRPSLALGRPLLRMGAVVEGREGITGVTDSREIGIEVRHHTTGNTRRTVAIARAITEDGDVGEDLDQGRLLDRMFCIIEFLAFVFVPTFADVHISGVAETCAKIAGIV